MSVTPVSPDGRQGDVLIYASCLLALGFVPNVLQGITIYSTLDSSQDLMNYHVI